MSQETLLEGIASTWFYHLPDDTGTRSLCGKKSSELIHTKIPVETWGLKTHIKERYCSKCEHAAIAKSKPVAP